MHDRSYSLFSLYTYVLRLRFALRLAGLAYRSVYDLYHISPLITLYHFPYIFAGYGLCSFHSLLPRV